MTEAILKRCGVIALLPLLAVGCRIDPDAFSDSESREDSSGRIQFQWNGPDSRLQVTAKGELRFSDSDADIVSISSDGEFAVEERRGGTIRRLEISPREDGSLIRAFSIDGHRREFDADAREWLRRVLPRVLRETAFDAAGRVQRLKARAGIEGVLDEISRIESSSARRIYLEALLDVDLDRDALLRAIREAEPIGSSSELSRILTLLAIREPGDSSVTAALVEASRQIQSSSSRRQALTAIVQERELDDGNVAALAEAAAEMRSDSEKAATLRSIAEKSSAGRDGLAALLDAAATIRSSSEKSLVVRDLLSGRPPDDQNFIKAAEVVSTIRSSSEKSLALVKLAAVLNGDDKGSRSAFLSAVAGVDSVSDQERALSALVVQRGLNQEALREILAFVEAELPEGSLRSRLADRIRRKLQ